MNPVDIEQWEFQQKKAFRNWANYWLRSGGYTERKIENVIDDVQDGVILINLFQALSGQQIPRYVKKPKLTAQKLENLTIVLNAFKDYGIVANVSPEDFLKGNDKFILGYLWRLIQKFQVRTGAGGAAGGNSKSTRDQVLEWVKDYVDGYPIHEDLLKDSPGCFKDGRVLSFMIHKTNPDLIDLAEMEQKTRRERLQQAFELAEKIGIPEVIDANDLMGDDVQEKTLLVYLSSFKDAAEKYQKLHGIENLKSAPPSSSSATSGSDPNEIHFEKIEIVAEGSSSDEEGGEVEFQQVQYEGEDEGEVELQQIEIVEGSSSDEEGGEVQLQQIQYEGNSSDDEEKEITFTQVPVETFEMAKPVIQQVEQDKLRSKAGVFDSEATPQQEVLLCPICEEYLTGRIVSVMTLEGEEFLYHTKCWICSECRKELLSLGLDFFRLENYPYCAECYHRLINRVCAKCDKIARHNPVKAMGKVWHSECFVCTKCGYDFADGKFYNHEGQPYCETHYDEIELNQNICGRCGKGIAGDIVSALGKKWHDPECWVCNICEKELEGKFFNIDGFPRCEDCARK